MQTTLNLTTVYDVIDYINEHAKTAVERGSWWERAVVFYLRNDPEMRQIMGDVRLWADAPTNDGHDTGIDVVGEYSGVESDDEMRYWAVQCKNYDPSHKMDYKELSTFWAKAEADDRYAGYAVVSASDFSKNAYAHAEQTGTLLINVTITGIPEEAQGYVVNGRSPLDWVIDRYQVKTDKKSGITNDPNDYSDDPCYIINLIARLVRVSMETQQIVQSLPTNIDEIPHPDNWPAEWMVQS